MESRQPNSTDPTAAIDDDRSAVARWIEWLSSHLNPPPGGLDGAEAETSMALALEPCAGRAKIDVDTEQLTKYMRGRYRDVQQGVYDYFNSRPELQTPVEISKDEHRELCMRQLMGLVREVGIRHFRYVVEDPAISAADLAHEAKITEREGRLQADCIGAASAIFNYQFQVNNTKIQL